MKILMAVALIAIGVAWLYHASFVPMGMQTRAMSDAMSLESKLKRWAMDKVEVGKLTIDDVDEIFPESYSLQLGGENPHENFREMIKRISRPNEIPKWPGLASILLGFAGVISCIIEKCRATPISNSSGV